MRQLYTRSCFKSFRPFAAHISRQYDPAASSFSNSPRVFSTSPTKHSRHQRTIQPPETPFDPSASVKPREILFRNRTTDSLYQWQQHNRKDSDVWYLQDSPTWPLNPAPLGHAFNKILKDVVNRYHLLKGKRVIHRLGWHVHGLPIEAKLLGNRALSGNNPKDWDPVTVAEVARSYAVRETSTETNELQLFGMMADRSDPYDTGNPSYEAKQLEVFAEIVRKGLVFRSERPVYWSPWSHSAMEEAEIYQDGNMIIFTFFVFCPFEPSKSLLAKVSNEAQTALNSSQVSALIYTTRPWSLVGNMALAVNPEMKYCLVEMNEPDPHRGAKFWVAADRMAWLSQRKVGITLPGGKDRPLVGALKILATVPGHDLLDCKYRSPLQPVRSPSRPIFDASFVNNETGTGLRNVAPSHNHDDFDLCVAKGLIAPPSGPPLRRPDINGASIHDSPGSHTYQKLYSPIDAGGVFLPQVAADNPLLHDLAGRFALKSGVLILRNMLWDSGHLMSDIQMRETTPTDWTTSKQSLIVRATHQWFIDLERIKPKARHALAKVNFIPESSRATMENIVQGRREWCISRQRSWGLPLPVLYDAETQEPLLTAENVMHIASVFKRHGSAYWWQGKPEEFVAPQYLEPGKRWIKGKDTMDVWFDSGVAWAASDTIPDSPHQRNQPIADVCIEDIDQHRGWIQSSLWTKLAYDPEDAEPTAPYKTVAFHGYVMDRKGHKMEQTLGKIIYPSQIITGEGVKASKQPGVGTDVMRYVVSQTTKWGTNSRVSHLVSKHASKSVTILRTSIRFLLSYLPLPELTPNLEDAEVQAGLTLLDRFILHELHVLEYFCTESYESLNLSSIGPKMLEFDRNVLDPLYLRLIKPTLLNESVNSPRRKAALAVADQLLRTITNILAPILPHMAEEVWHFRSGAQKNPELTFPGQSIPGAADGEPSFFKEPWQSVSDNWLDPSSHQAMHRVWDLRRAVLDMIEQARERIWARKTLETQLTIQIDQDLIRSNLDPASQQLLEIIDKHTATRELEDWLSLAQLNTLEPVPLALVYLQQDTIQKTKVQADRLKDPTDWSQWTLRAWLPLYNKDGTEATGLQLIMQPSGKGTCPRCLFSRKPDGKRACERCEDAMKDMGISLQQSMRPGEADEMNGESDEEEIIDDVEEAEENLGNQAR